MSWDTATWDMELLNWYKKMIAFRRSSTALACGGFQVLLVEPDTLVYQRDSDEEVILVAAQRGSQARPANIIPVAHGAIPEGAEFEEIFTGQLSRVQGSRIVAMSFCEPRSW